MKMVTLSYDDGVTQDKRLIEIFNYYGLRCTFNICSASRSPKANWKYDDLLVEKLNPEDAHGIYNGHEIAMHTCTHINIPKTEDDILKHEIIDDQKQLEILYNCKVTGMAYPFGLYDNRAIKVLKDANILYARTTNSNYSFDIQQNLLEFNPTCHHNDDRLMEMADMFLGAPADKLQIFYLWGHSYEFDHDENWDRIEDFCKFISNKKDVFYGTNTEVFLRQLA